MQQKQSKKALSNIQALIVLLILAAIALYSAFNYKAHIQQLTLMEEKIQEMQTSQNLMIQLLEKRFTEQELEEFKETNIQEVQEEENSQ